MYVQEFPTTVDIYRTTINKQNRETLTAKTGKKIPPNISKRSLRLVLRTFNKQVKIVAFYSVRRFVFSRCERWIGRWNRDGNARDRTPTMLYLRTL